MKEYMKMIIIVGMLIILFITTGFGLFYQTEKEERISEEAFPILEGETTTGIEYVITIGKQVQDKKLILSTYILESVLHYKEIQTINQFLIQLEIENHTSTSYLLKNIFIVDTTTNVVIEDISYSQKKNSNTFSFYLDQSFFQKYKKEYKVLIELEK